MFPGANVALLAMRQPELVLGFDIQGRLAPIAAELRELLPRLNVGARAGGLPRVGQLQRPRFGSSHALCATSRWRRMLSRPPSYASHPRPHLPAHPPTNTPCLQTCW